MREFELISSYTRKQAIADGSLIDVTKTAKEIGFVCPVATTRSVWLRCVDVTGSRQSLLVRLCSVLIGLRTSILYRPFLSFERELEHEFNFYIRDTNGEPMLLKALSSHEGNGHVCITVMLPEED
jgi:hypothetical protein